MHTYIPDCKKKTIFPRDVPDNKASPQLRQRSSEMDRWLLSSLSVHLMLCLQYVICNSICRTACLCTTLHVNYELCVAPTWAVHTPRHEVLLHPLRSNKRLKLVAAWTHSSQTGGRCLPNSTSGYVRTYVCVYTYILIIYIYTYIHIYIYIHICICTHTTGLLT